MCKALIWDFDGTLAYRDGGGFGASIRELIQKEATGWSATAQQIRPYLQSGFPWHTPGQAHLETKSADQWWERVYPVFERAFLGVGINSAQAKSLARKVRPIYTNPERWRLYDDVVATLELLSSQGWLHVILSNHVPELHEIVKHLGLEQWIEHVFNSAEIGYEKPHPEAFRIVLVYLSDTNAKCMIGDSVSADIEGASSVGIPGVLVRKHSKGAKHYADDLAQLPGVLLRALGDIGKFQQLK